MEKLKKAYDSLASFIVSKDLFKDEEKFFEKDKELGKWAIEPKPMLEGALQQQPQAVLASGPTLPNNLFPFPSSKPSSQSGYPAAIVLSVALISLVYLTNAKLFSSGLAFLFGALALTLFFGFVFGPAIIDKLAQYLASSLSSGEDEKKSVSDLFEEAHSEYTLVLFFTKHEKDGKIVDDKQIESKSKLSNIYRKIYAISEGEWYMRKLINDSNTIKMSSGTSSASQVSDFSG